MPRDIVQTVAVAIASPGTKLGVPSFGILKALGLLPGPNLAAFVTVKTTAEEYCEFFWAHAKSKTLTYKDMTFTLDATRSEFCDEEKTKIYKNTKNPKELCVVIDNASMAKMGAVMGSDAFVKAGEKLWTMGPDAVTIRTAAPASETPDLLCFLTVKTTPEEYMDFFWSHAKSKTLTYKDETFTLDMSRSEFCDEKKTKIYQNVKNPNELCITISAAKMDKMGAVMGSDAFVKAGEKLWTIDKDAVQFLSLPPPPPAP